MGEGAGVLDELVGAQAAHVADAFDRARALVGGKFLVAEDGEPFLQAELEPVAAGDAVAGPIVEVFVGDDRFRCDRSRLLGRGLGRASTYLSLNVEPLVLHRPHVEIGDRHRS
jgi:hypothetical protein